MTETISKLDFDEAVQQNKTRGASYVPSRLEFLTSFHSILNVCHILKDHIFLLAWFWIGERILPIVFYIPITLLVCLIHQRAMSEWLHEGAHHNLLRSYRWNDWVADIFVGVSFLMPVARYRATHFIHHSQDHFFMNDRDTDFLNISTRREFWKSIFCDLTGVTAIRQYLRFRKEGRQTIKQKNLLRCMMMAHVTMIAILFYFKRLDIYILYYATLLFLYPLHNRVRVYGQHVGIDFEQKSSFRESSVSRTIDAGLIDRIIFTSPLLLYHYEHHKWPHLPYRALSRLCARSIEINRYVTDRWKIMRLIYLGLPNFVCADKKF